MATKPCVKDLMTGVLETARENETLLEVAERMAEADVGAIPICNETGELRGIITDRDIVVRGIAAGRDPATTTVGEIETGGVRCIAPEDSLEEAARTMASERVRRLPVMSGEELVGIITQADLARALAPEYIGTVVHEISKG